MVEAHDIGAGYAALSAYSDVGDDAEAVYGEMRDAMEKATTAHISRCERDSEFGEDTIFRRGDFIGFVGKRILESGESRERVLEAVLNSLGLSERETLLIIAGEDASESDTSCIEAHILRNYPRVETYTVDGGQPVYDYIIVAE